MRRSEIKRHIEELEALDKVGGLIRDEQIDLWFKRMMFDLTATVEDKSEQPLAENNYKIDYLEPEQTRPVNTPLPPTQGGRGFNDWRQTVFVDTTPGDVTWHTTEPRVFATREDAPRVRERITETYIFNEFEHAVNLHMWDGIEYRIDNEWVEEETGTRYITISYDSN